MEAESQEHEPSQSPGSDGAMRGSSGTALLPSEAITCSLCSTGLFGWALCSDGLCHLQAQPLLFALPSWQVAQRCHPVLTVTCATPSLQPLPWQGSAFLPLEALVRNSFLTQSHQAHLYFWGLYVLVLPVFSPAFAGFPAQLPAACTLGLNCR